MPLAADQSNSCVVYGRRLFLKLFRKLVPGINPELEIGRFLAASGTFSARAGALRFAGIQAVASRTANRSPWACCSDSRPANRPGKRRWTVWRTYFAARLAIAAARIGREPPVPSSRLPKRRRAKPQATSADPAPRCGALAAAAAGCRWPNHWPATICEKSRSWAGAPPNCISRLASDTEQAAIRSRAVYRKASAIAALVDARFGLAHLRIAPATAGASAGRSAAGGPRSACARIAAAGAVRRNRRRARSTASAFAATAIIILGQVIDTGDDFVIIDFEGEPARPLRRAAREAFAADRRGRHDPLAALRRVASAVSAIAIRRGGRHRTRGALRMAARLLVSLVGRGFLGGVPFHGRSRAASCPAVAAICDRLLGLFVLEKAVYELAYELNNRPDWVEVPLSGLLELLGQPR